MNSNKSFKSHFLPSIFYILIYPSICSVSFLFSVESSAQEAKFSNAEEFFEIPPFDNNIVSSYEEIDISRGEIEKLNFSRKIAQSITVPSNNQNSNPSVLPGLLPVRPEKPSIEFKLPETDFAPEINPDTIFEISEFRSKAKKTKVGEQPYNQEIFKSIKDKIAIRIENNKVTGIIICTTNLAENKDCISPSKTLSNFNDSPIDQKIEFTFTQLFQITKGISDLYTELGFKTSGATISFENFSDKGTPEKRKTRAVLEIVEGYIRSEDINITVIPAKPSYKLSSEYIKSQLVWQLSKPLNITNLQKSLQLLQLDPLVSSVTAKLETGDEPGKSILNVDIQEAKQSLIGIDFNNSRSPLTGEFERRATLKVPNLLGIGDQGSVSFANTEGSNAVDFNYTIPLNSYLDTLKIAYGQGNSEIIEEPFRDINRDGQPGDIRSTSKSFDISIRHPVDRQIYQQGLNNTEITDFAIGLVGSWRESNSTLLGIPFPLSTGADNNGSTKIAAIRAFQEFSRRDSLGAGYAVRSQFNFGVGALGSSVSDGSTPDSRFASWQLQFLGKRRFSPEQIDFIMRLNAQLSLNPLVSSEQFAVGGYYNVRGYRRDALQKDNGISYSIDVPWTIAKLPDNYNTIQIVPFFDAGVGWNASGDSSRSSWITAIGLGLQWKRDDNITARIDYGIPLQKAATSGASFQDNGLYFTLQWNSF